MISANGKSDMTPGADRIVLSSDCAFTLGMLFTIIFFSCIGFCSVSTEWNSCQLSLLCWFSANHCPFSPTLGFFLMSPGPDLLLSEAHAVPKFHSFILSFEVGLTPNLKVFPLPDPICICLRVFYRVSGDNVQRLILNKSVFVFNYQHFNKYFISL